MGRPRGQYIPKRITGDPRDRFGFPALVDEFCEDLAVRGYSLETIRVSRSHLAKLVDWLNGEGVTHPGDVTRAMLEQYQQYLHLYRKADGRPLTLTSQGACLGPVKRFYQWGVAHDRVARDPTVGLTVPRREQRLPKAVLTVEEAERVLDQPDVRTPLGLRDRAMLEVLYSTGIRRGEMSRLQITDLDRGRRAVLIRQAKGRKDRNVPIGARALSWVDAYLREARPALRPVDRSAVFISAEDGRALTAQRMSRLVSGYVDAAEIAKHGGCHLFRHTVATLMLDSGADIRYVQAMLGHANLNSTQIYTHVSLVALQAVHAATFPDDPATDATRWPAWNENLVMRVQGAPHR